MSRREVRRLADAEVLVVPGFLIAVPHDSRKVQPQGNGTLG